MYSTVAVSSVNITYVCRVGLITFDAFFSAKVTLRVYDPFFFPGTTELQLRIDV